MQSLMRQKRVLKPYMHVMPNFWRKMQKLQDSVIIQANPLYEQNIRQLNTATNLVASNTFLKFLQENNDPRATDFFGANATGLDQADFLNSSNAALGASIFKQSATDPVVFLSAAESYFLQAEARERYFSGDGAKQLYNNGVVAAFSALG